MTWTRWLGSTSEMPPLHWRPTSETHDEGSMMHDAARANGQRTVAILCCRHGHHCGLVLGGDSKFSISSAGVVNPSVQCPVEIADVKCSGHENPGSVLEGWTG